MAEEPDLVVSAGFSDAQLVKEANKVVAFYKKRGEEAQKAFLDAQGKVTNTQAAKAHTRELDKLSKEYDPVYRAAKRYEDQLRKLDRALDVGAISQKQYTDQVGRAAKEMNTASGMIEQTARKASGGGNSLQQVGWQVGDFAVQVGAGTSAAQAFGQQLPQLLGAFGTWGALAGAGAAIAIPLGAALFKVAMDAESLDDRIKSLNDTTETYTSLAEAAATPIDDLRRSYGDLADEVDRANRTVALLAGIRAKNDLFGTTRALSGGLGIDLNPREQLRNGDGSVNRDRAFMEQKRMENVMDMLQRKTGATADQAERLAMALRRTDSSNSLDAVVKDAENLLAVIAELSGNEGADQAFLGSWATQVSTVMRAAQDQIRATKSEFERVTEQYQTDTEKLKKLSNDRKIGEELLATAIKTGSEEAIRLARERLGLIDQEIGKTRELILANDDAYKAMQKRIQAGAGGFIDRVVEGATGTSLTQWGKDIEASQKGILELIKSRESGGDYNATLDNGRYTGGARDLVNMTINEVLAMQKQMLAHPDNTKNSSAAGAYQIVSKTLAGLVGELGLSGNELYSREMQDRLAQQLLRRRRGQGVEGLRNEWEGLNGVSPAVIQQAMGQQSIPLVDGDVQKRLEKEIQDRERLAEQARKYGEQLQQNLLTEQESSRLAASQAVQISAIKAQGLSPEAEARAIAQVTAEIEKQKTVMMLMADAKRRNVDLDTLMTGSTMTYKQAIEALGDAKKADIIATNERALAEGKVAESQAFMAQAQKTLEDGFIDAIIAGESFSDVLGNVAQMLAKAALQAALFGTGPFGGGGGLFSGLLSAIIPGGRGANLPARAMGGPVSAGQPYMVGERGPEPFVPAVNGRILSVAQAQAAIRGGQSGGGKNVNMTIDLRGTTGDRELDRKIAAAGRQILSQVPATMDDYQRRVR